MDKEKIKNRVFQILYKTFNIIDEVYKYRRENVAFYGHVGSRLVFPRYSLKHKNDDKRGPITRISEQELRFAFVEQFNSLCKKNRWRFYYSVETPTDNRFIVSKAKEPRVAKKGEGSSGAFDLAIHNGKGERICWIEFKALMKPEKEFAKDFLKLNKEATNGLGFFIHMLEKADDSTFKSIIDDKVKNPEDVEYVCHVLPDPKKGKESVTYYSLQELKDYYMNQ